jgi:hypothetical protein
VVAIVGDRLSARTNQTTTGKLQWLHDPSQINGDTQNNVRLEASRHFRNKRREYLEDKINELAKHSKNNDITYPYKGINKFKNSYESRSNFVKDENGDLLAGSHNI